MIITTRSDGNMNDSNSSSANGSCLCRGVQFRVASTEFSGHPKVAHCYCQMCRKFHGSAFSTFMEVRRDKLEWTKGEDLIKNFSMINEAGRETIRSFCSTCGSSLLFDSEFNKTDGTICRGSTFSIRNSVDITGYLNSLSTLARTSFNSKDLLVIVTES